MQLCRTPALREVFGAESVIATDVRTPPPALKAGGPFKYLDITHAEQLSRLVTEAGPSKPNVAPTPLYSIVALRACSFHSPGVVLASDEHIVHLNVCLNSSSHLEFKHWL